MTVLETAEQIFLPFVVVAELRAGFAVGSKGLANERVLRRLLNKPSVELLLPTDATTRAYAALYRQLRAQGTPIASASTAAMAVTRKMERKPNWIV